MKKKNKNEKLLNLQTKVKNNLNKICDFNNNINLIKVKTNSCYDFNKATLTTNDNFIPNIDNSNEDIPNYKSKIVDMYVNNNQTYILNKWFDSYVDMYNVVIRFFIKNNIYDDVRNLKIIYNDNKDLYLDITSVKKEIKLLQTQKKKLINDYNKILRKKKTNKSTKISKIKNNKYLDEDKNKINNLIKNIGEIKNNIKKLNIIVDYKNKQYNKSSYIKKTEYSKVMMKINWKNVRTYHLKDIRDHIQTKSSNIKNLTIRTHIIDCAIKTACTSYKSCISNYLNGNSKKFKIRYWRHNKKNKVMEIPKEFIRKNELLKDVFGKFKFVYNNKPYQLTGNETVSILYKSEIRKYYLLIAEKIEFKQTKSTKYIAIDQGIKPFMSCRTNNELINVGTNVATLVGNYLNKIDKINNTDTMNKKQKRKKERKCYLKIKNTMDEVHWKTIKYITDNYGNVVIGNLSMKDASKNETSKLSPMLKRIGMMLRFSEFRNRLRYKCLINGIKIEIIDEAYTSKVCNTCGNCKHELEGEKEYECKVCNIKRDRDFNSATNMILLKM